MNLWGFWAQNYTYKTHTRYEKPIIILRPTIKTEKYDMQGHMVILRPKEGIELLLYCFVLTELTCACSCTHTHRGIKYLQSATFCSHLSYFEGYLH